MPIGVDDLLIAMGAAAAEGFGKELARGLLSGVSSGNLATKEDLRKAVLEIESYIHQEFEAVQDRAVVHDVDVAILHLNQYRTSRNVSLLNIQEVQSRLNSAWADIDLLSATRGLDYFRVQFVPVTRFVATNFAFWSVLAYDINIQGAEKILIDVIKDGITKLKTTRQYLHLMEDETVSALTSQGNSYVEPRDPGSPRGPFNRNHEGYACFTLYRGRYNPPTGQKKIETGWIFNRTGKEAEDILRPRYQENLTRVDSETKSRLELIYSPLEEAIASMLDLLGKTGNSLVFDQPMAGLNAMPERI
ncbi:hypothetical protein [Cupriavidus pauculus]|uniref:hypothetical protein n=1 Tax=Cupriavidus pauculus TaxID=82633 RepID=UPI001EE38D36|nr:hypothetical protein [Cupriavidus pauculus]GJG96835.1 hypothetical protein CBA19C6_20120 [Cupriavidus pauculus]